MHLGLKKLSTVYVYACDANQGRVTTLILEGKNNNSPGHMAGVIFFTASITVIVAATAAIMVYRY